MEGRVWKVEKMIILMLLLLRRTAMKGRKAEGRKQNSIDISDLQTGIYFFKK
jgi:hypothetical protein